MFVADADVPPLIVPGHCPMACVAPRRDDLSQRRIDGQLERSFVSRQPSAHTASQYCCVLAGAGDGDLASPASRSG